MCGASRDVMPKDKDAHRQRRLPSGPGLLEGFKEATRPDLQQASSGQETQETFPGFPGLPAFW